MDIAAITAITSSIAAIAAIVSPVITALITQRGNYRLKTAELFFNAKAKAYEEAICSITTFPNRPDDRDLINLHNVISRAILFSSDDTAQTLSVLGKIILDGPISAEKLQAYSEEWELALSAMKKEIVQYQK